MPSLASCTVWIESLSPWPEEFGLGRMRTLVERLGHPERRYPAIHVVGTNGKSTATRTIAALLQAEGRRAGAYTSPHVSGWAERIWVDGDEADFERAIARVRTAAEAVGATQFEVLTAAALVEFAEQEVDVAAVEAGLGGRLDATNVVDAEVVLLTNVSLEHTEVLGKTAHEIAKEKLAVAHAARVVVVSDNDVDDLIPKHAETVRGGAQQAAEAFLGRPIAHGVAITLPGRFERQARGEIWDGAHTPEAADWLVERLPSRDYVLCLSILQDKDAEGLLVRLARAGGTAVVTQSSNPRSLDADELGARARRHFERVEVVGEPLAAVARARELGTPLVTGSLYLVADIYRAKEHEAR